MRLLMYFLISALLISSASAVDFGLVSVNDTINFPLVCMDTLGRSSAPDSVHVVTWYHGEGANDSTYSARSTGPLSTPYIDSVNMAGGAFYFFKDIVGDLDGSEGNGPYSGAVALWDQGYPTYNIFSFTKISGEAKALADDLIAVYDSIKSHDDWIARQSEVANIDGWAPLNDNDSLIIDFSSLSSASVDINVASVNANALEAGDFEDGFLKPSKIEDGAITSAKIADGALDSAAFTWNYFDWLKETVWRDTISNYLEITGEAQQILRIIKDYVDGADIGAEGLDSLSFYDDYWTAIQDASGTVSIPDSVAARIDSILFKIGAFGFTESASTSNTMLQWLMDLELKVDSTNTSLGYDPSTSAHSKIENLTLSGGGTEPETLIVISFPESTLIEGAEIVVRTIDQSTVKVDGLATGINGRRILELDPDSFFVALTHNNYTQSLDTIVVPSGGGTDTLWMTTFNPGDPPSADLCRVFGWVYNIAGAPVKNAEISAQITSEYHPVKYSGIVITPFKKTTVTDSTGYWAMDLLPNSLLSSPESEYMVTIEYPSGIIFRTKTAVPDSSSWQLQ